MAEISGSTDSRFQSLVDVIEQQLDNGYDLGSSLAVAVDGQLVCDVWGGYVDEARSEPWQADTITNVWSTTKTMTALSALLLIDRGELDPHEKVATYWPEFGAAGKGDIEVRHIMSHTSGVSAWAQPVTVDDILDDDKATAMLAEQEPWWEPGTASGYHALNQGHLVGEVIRRIDGRGLKQFFAEEIAGPLDADFTIGSPVENHHRISNVIPPPPLPIPEDIDPESVAIKTFTGPAPEADIAHTAAWRAATIGAANGHGNARSVAKIQAVVSNGGSSNGVSLLSADTLDRIFEEQSNGIDLVLGLPLRFGLGFGLSAPDNPMGITSGRICYWGGWGGSIVVNDLDNRLTMTYMMNRMQAGLVGNDTSMALVSTLGTLL
ncbi:MAG: beta-lactamase family protein [Acidimicrobiia bacterium]|nr:beta-lactamase family protein [Acidimicrobiia bacterium]MDH5520150.1 beta-lactamase family protein [Acidimicrobiia bacterium]